MTPAEGGWRMHGHMPAWGRVAFLGRPSIQRVGKNLQRCLPETRFLGSACWVAWILLVYSTEFLSPTADVHGYNALCYLVSTMAISLVYLGFGLSGAGGYRLISRRWPVLIAGAAASLGTAVIVAASYLPESFVALCVVGNVLTGAGTGVVSMRCACLYGELSARNAFMTAFCMMFVAMLIYGTTLTFPHVAAVAVTVLLPCAAALATMIDESSDATARSAGSRVLGPGFKRFVAVVFLLSFAFTISRGFYPNALQIGQFNESRGIVSLWCLVLCAVVVLVIAGLPDSLALGSLGFWIILVSALILAVHPADRLLLAAYRRGVLDGLHHAWRCVLGAVWRADVDQRPFTAARLWIWLFGVSAWVDDRLATGPDPQPAGDGPWWLRGGRLRGACARRLLPAVPKA